MVRRRRAKEDSAVLAVKAVFAVLILLALAGGLTGFAERLMGLIVLTVLGSIALAALVGIIWVVRRTDWSALKQDRHNNPRVSPNVARSTTHRTQAAPAFEWTTAGILEHMTGIDWYQFEKFCAAILEAEGFEVQRKGGASPDGGVDLVARKNQTRTLIQCKHWRTWKIKEPVIRQLLGSMVDFQVDKGAVFFSGESTAPAKEFAAKHGIGLVDGQALAERAFKALSTNSLDLILKCKDHHCPKCESLMIWRTGDFKPFWGCSRYPKCRGTLKHSGPR